MREENRINIIKAIKKALYQVYLKDDTASISAMVLQAEDLWDCSKDEFMEILINLEKKKIIKIERKLDLVWMDEGFASKIDENQSKLYIETAYY